MLCSTRTRTPQVVCVVSAVSRALLRSQSSTTAGDQPAIPLRARRLVMEPPRVPWEAMVPVWLGNPHRFRHRMTVAGCCPSQVAICELVRRGSWASGCARSAVSELVSTGRAMRDPWCISPGARQAPALFNDNAPSRCHDLQEPKAMVAGYSGALPGAPSGARRGGHSVTFHRHTHGPFASPVSVRRILGAWSRKYPAVACRRLTANPGCASAGQALTGGQLSTQAKPVPGLRPRQTPRAPRSPLGRYGYGGPMACRS